MIIVNTLLEVSDNSGVRFCKCIKIYKKSKNPFAFIGDLILISIKKTIYIRNHHNKNSKDFYNIGDMLKGVIIKSKRNTFRYGGIYIRFNSNTLVLFNSRNDLLGSRILHPVAFEICNITSYLKIISLSSCII